MSQMLKAKQIMDCLKQDCIDAWGLIASRVHFDQVRIPEAATDYALIKMLPVQMSPLAAVTVRQDYSFEIRRRAPFPSSGNITEYKIDEANVLISKIITGPKYNDLAFLPYITAYEPTEDDDPQNRYLEFTVTFTCSVEENHH